MLLAIILATVLISCISLVGVFFGDAHIRKFMHYFISFAAAVLIAITFFDLLPEALEELELMGVHLEHALVWVVVGIVLFFLVERFIHWHHCDKEDCHEKPAGMLVLTGDFVHNFIDGLLIAGAFLLNVPTGIVTSISVAVHEIPQEIGDYAVLIHSGYSRGRALWLNFLSALSAVIGGVLGYYLFDSFTGIAPYAVLLVAGGFLYIALSDIVPALHRHHSERKVQLLETLLFVGTMVAVYFLLGALGHGH